MLTLPELNVVMPLLDAGVRASGLQVFHNGGGATLQTALAKLQAMADAAAAAPAETQAKEAANGEDQHHD